MNTVGLVSGVPEKYFENTERVWFILLVKGYRTSQGRARKRRKGLQEAKGHSGATDTLGWDSLAPRGWEQTGS